MDENELLDAELGQTDEYNPSRSARMISEPLRVSGADYVQWAMGPNQEFRPSGKTIGSLPAGAYIVAIDHNGQIFLQSKSPISDEIVELPDAANVRVLQGIRNFWQSREKYLSHGLLFKRGVLLWGPPGSGKTAGVTLLTRDLIANGGIVIYATTTPTAITWILRTIRQVEPERPLIVVMEDLDEYLNQWSEHEVLSLLDGESQIANVVYVATTNYPDRLGARIVNRPSRFDERVYVGMPKEATRKAYLAKAARGLGSDELAKWSKDTDGLSIAHLRELVAAVVCLGNDYSETLRRLRSMCERPKDRDNDGFAKRTVGLGEAA